MPADSPSLLIAPKRGQVTWLQPLQTLLMIGTVGFASALALIPRQRTLVQISALGAAVIIATQLTLEHWFYLYIAWFLGMLIAAIAPDTADHEAQPAPREKDIRADRSRARARAQLRRARQGRQPAGTMTEESQGEFQWPTRRSPGEEKS